MLDINLFRPDKGGDPEAVRRSQRRRFEDVASVDVVVEQDAVWRREQYEAAQLSKQLNAASKQVAALRKRDGGGRSGSDALELDVLMARCRTLKADAEGARASASAALETRDAALRGIGNLVDDDVPTGRDEDAGNVTLRAWPPGAPPPSRQPWMLGHADLVARLGAVDLEAGAAAAGGRGYYLLGAGVMLNQALVSYALQFLAARGFEPVYTPFFLTRDVMAQCAQLSQFDQELYRVTVDAGKSAATGVQASPSPQFAPGEGSSSTSDVSDADKFLIATSEQPLCAMHRGSWLEAARLPLRYAGLSTCFRREAGSHGRDTAGIFRVHQFEKVEQFVVARPDDGSSRQLMEEMIGHAGEFYESLGIPYRVVSVVSGALNHAASKKYDLEGWFPHSGAYRELVSCSNCTDYQARRLDTRVRLPGSAQAPHPHMLNATLAATQRALTCLVENHQTEGGVVVPPPLRPFLMGQELFPFTRALPAAATAARKLAK